MTNFQYLNYEDVNERLTKLVDNPNTNLKVRKEYPLGFTDYLLPIEHYTMGHGSKHIIVTGSYHSAEIITTIFIVQLMEDLALNANSFNPNEYTIHFIPIVNPEGYLITTSMQDLYLNKGKTEEEKIDLAKKYYQAYREDAIRTLKAKKDNDVITLRGKKAYQALFDDVNLDDFLTKYPDLKESVLQIIKENDYPIGVCAAWSANGHGIDLSQNVPFNVNIKSYLESEEAMYSGTAYSNIRKDIPGPINCPCRDLNNFAFEKENLALMNFLASLNAREDEEIVAFINYHSVMGKMYQRPVRDEGMIGLYNINYDKRIVDNYLGARLMREENAYDILEGEDPYSYINEFFRLRYGINIQPELSRMGSNPIGPLADDATFKNVTIRPNIAAFKKFVHNLTFINEYSRFINTLVNKLNDKRIKENKALLDVQSVYRIIDMICQKNPTLYAKLREEINSGGYNSHVIEHLFYLIEENILCPSISESEVFKEDDIFIKYFRSFINDFVSGINGDRIVNVQELISNICRDYPELFARIKCLLNESNPDMEEVKLLFQDLESILNNQVKMGNLLK